MRIFSFLLLLTCSLHAQSTSVLIDFGNTASPAPWNNISDTKNGAISGLLNTFGLNSGIDIAITDAFNGINTNGSSMPDPALDMPASATGDSFFGNTVIFNNDVQPTGGIRLSKLDTGKVYHLTLFASRMSVSDNRETRYILIGAETDTLYLNVANNSSMSVGTSMKPSAAGLLEVLVSPGPNNTNSNGFFYLGALRLNYEATPPAEAISLIRPVGGEFWQSGKTVRVLWSGYTQQALALSYSIDGGSNWIALDTLPPTQQSYNWTLPNTPSEQCLFRLHNDVVEVRSPAVFTISSDPEECPIVVLGSSTAAGAGVSTPDSAWVNRYRETLYGRDTRYPVINLAQGGYTSYHILPTGTTIPVNITIDTNRNITRALQHLPAAIIINMPSNDAANNFPVQDQMANFRAVIAQAAQAGVPVWVCSAQPRNFSNASQIQIQNEVRDSVFAAFGAYAIDFWNGLAAPNGFILTEYNSGDGIHLNDKAHRLLLNRVLAKQLDTLCRSGLVSTGRPPATEDAFKVYPNPFNRTLHLELECAAQTALQIQIFDLSGKQLYEKNSTCQEGGKQQINLAFDLAGVSKPSWVLLQVRLRNGHATTTLQRRLILE